MFDSLTFDSPTANVSTPAPTALQVNQTVALITLSKSLGIY